MTALTGAPGGLRNLRDLGGLPTTDGAVTRTGVLYRSDVPLAGDARPHAVPVWPPATVLDLRAPAERARAPHPLAGPDTVVHTIALIDDTRFTGAAADRLPPRSDLTAWFVALYRLMSVDRPAAVVAAVELAARSASPLLVHCAAGRDRTGVVVALLLLAAGVEPEAVMADYRRTEANQAAVLDRLADSGGIAGSHARDPRLRTLSTPEAITGLIDEVVAHRDGARGWLVAHGAGRAGLGRWRRVLVG